MTRKLRPTLTCAGFVLLASTLTAVHAADAYQLKALDEPVPKDSISEEVRAEISPKGLRIVGADGKPYLDLWLRRTIETRKPDIAVDGVDFGTIPEGALVAVARYHARTKDFRGRRFPAGVVTLRKATQPEDGDHQGVSETRDFLLLCAAKEDKSPRPVPAKDLLELATKVSGRKHPAILYLVRLFSEPKEKPALEEDEEREFWVLDCKIPNRKKDEKPVRLGVVVVGETEEF